MDYWEDSFDVPKEFYMEAMDRAFEMKQSDECLNSVEFIA